MRIHIQSSLLELTPSIRAYVEKKFLVAGKFLKRLEEENEMVVHIEVARKTRHHRKGDVYYVEATLVLPGKTIRIEQDDEKLRAGIDDAQKRFIAELERHKEKTKSRDRKEIRTARKGSGA